jgi:hypothetical protein
MAMFEEWYLAREGSLFERRLDTYAHRLMVLLAVTSAKAAVDTEVMARSVRKLISCSGRAMVVAQQPAQPLAAAHVGGPKRAGLRRDQLVAQPLMISLPMVVRCGMGLLDVTRRGLPHQATTPAWP